MTRIVLTLVLLVAFVAACIGVAVVRGSTPVAPLETPASTGAPAIADASEPVATPWLAVVVPANEVLVTIPVPARIAAVLVDLGDRVDAGQPIATLDPDVAKRALAEARAQLAARQADRRRADVVLAQKRDHLDRIARLGALVSEAERADAELSAAAARADLDRAVAEIRVQRVLVTELEARLRDTTIRAPIAGEVSARLLDAGARVDSGAPLLRVVEHTRRIRFAVDADATPPAVGAAVHVRCAAGVTTTAVVTHVSPGIDPVTRVVLVEAEPAAAAVLRLGETCTTAST